jgi:cohesin complex subunit SA-1/2
MQAFQNLLNLHILFCPSQDLEAEDSPLSLTLDEEVQLRCAALVQAEVERFMEEVAVHSEVSDRSSDEGASGDNNTTSKKGGSRRRKKTNGAKETGAPALAGGSIG